MNEKIASILLICLVSLSIIYCYSITALPSHTTHYREVALSQRTTVTKENAKLSYSKPNLGVLGDPIDDPKPR